MAPQFQTYIPLSTKAERLATSLKSEIQSRDR
jgi:hypothetical protein